MKDWKEFDIDINQLNDNKEYTYSYQIGNAFFELVEFSPVKEGNIKADVVLVKNYHYLTLNIKIEGFVQLTCDRSLELFDFPIKTGGEVRYKLGNEKDEFSDDFFFIDEKTSKVNVAQHIYDWVILSVPIKKLHPKFKNENNKEELILIYSSSTEIKEDQQEETIDPRWKLLKELKNNKNIK